MENYVSGKRNSALISFPNGDTVLTLCNDTHGTEYTRTYCVSQASKRMMIILHFTLTVKYFKIKKLKCYDFKLFGFNMLYLSDDSNYTIYD